MDLESEMKRENYETPVSTFVRVDCKHLVYLSDYVAKHQIDIIVTKQRFKNSIKMAKSFPKTDADSGHNLMAITQKTESYYNQKLIKQL